MLRLSWLCLIVGGLVWWLLWIAGCCIDGLIAPGLLSLVVSLVVLCGWCRAVAWCDGGSLIVFVWCLFMCFKAAILFGYSWVFVACFFCWILRLCLFGCLMLRFGVVLCSLYGLIRWFGVVLIAVSFRCLQCSWVCCYAVSFCILVLCDFGGDCVCWLL